MVDTRSDRSLSIAYWCLAAAVGGASGCGSVDAQATNRASITIDAGSVQGPISPLLHGQFLEFMFEGIKSGLTAEMIRDRGFEAVPNVIGLPRDWSRYPDDRNDDYGLAFHWDADVAYAVATDHFEAAQTQHALRVDAGAGVVERRGIYQSRLPIRSGVTYRAGSRRRDLPNPPAAAWVETATGRPPHAMARCARRTASSSRSARGPFGPSPTSNSTESPSRRSLIPSPCTALWWSGWPLGK